MIAVIYFNVSKTIEQFHSFSVGYKAGKIMDEEFLIISDLHRVEENKKKTRFFLSFGFSVACRT